LEIIHNSKLLYIANAKKQIKICACKTAMIMARTEPYLKNKVEKIFQFLGLSSSEAIFLFFRQVSLQENLYRIRLESWQGY